MGDSFAERFNRSIRDLFESPIFEKSDANKIGGLPIITKQSHKGKHSSSKLKPIRASLKNIEEYFYQKIPNKRNENKKSLKFTTLSEKPVLMKTFPKVETTN